LGHPLTIYKNDQIMLDEFAELPVQSVILSPGPGTPDDSGITLDIIREYAGKLPILGICLGHECIGQVYGAKIIHAKKVMHGKVSIVHHDGEGIFLGVPNPIKVARYHSLIIDPTTLSDEFIISAWCENSDGTREIMGIRHKSLPIESVQFHPESILTEYGHLMFANFLNR
jgi:anthranilate synthase/aminodeoxychorismate synthase-like glutamine amidotransferase